MVNNLRLRQVLAAYKKDFDVSEWEQERYKWEAVKCFQEHWDIHTPDFEAMLKTAFAKTLNLLASMNNFPAGMIEGFAKTAPEEVRAMFLELFDEDRDVYERIKAFKDRSATLLERYGNGAGQHYQHENAITTYLWLRYPDQYYIYRFSICRAVSLELETDYTMKRGDNANNIRSFLKMYDEICEEIKKDEELVALLRSHLDDECCPDEELKTLTMDVCYYIYGRAAEKTMEQEQEAEVSDRYTKENFLSEVYMSGERYEALVGVLKHKKNIILQGAPGVGKTYAARRLAYAVMGERADERVTFIQFHQSYSYEDFMMGFKPKKEGDGFVLTPGIFYEFCKKAERQPAKEFFFIIDEINRGNMSKIFGELLMAIEKEYRGKGITLAYNGLTFAVPENIYIIGMMNTADRSLAMIDYALRRRFSFFEMEPGFETDGFKSYQERFQNETFDELIQRIIELNDVIREDRSLGKGFCIGHSYFCNQPSCTEEWMRSVVDYDILPTLGEYWFDDEEKQKRWENILHGVFQ